MMKTKADLAERTAQLAAEGSQKSPRASLSRRIPPKLYRIGELVDFAGVSRQTIHNYTSMGLIRESKWTSGGHRLYDEEAFLRLEKILEMKRRNRSMQEIRRHFETMDSQA